MSVHADLLGEATNWLRSDPGSVYGTQGPRQLGTLVQTPVDERTLFFFYFLFFMVARQMTVFYVPWCENC